MFAKAFVFKRLAGRKDPAIHLRCKPLQRSTEMPA